MSGDALLVGEFRRDNGSILNTGSAFVYRRDGMTWNLEQEIVPDGLIMSEEYGSCVVLKGDTAVVSSPGHQNAHGAIFVWRYDGDQ